VSTPQHTVRHELTLGHGPGLGGVAVVKVDCKVMRTENGERRTENREQRTENSGQWAVGSGQWAVGSGQWAVGSGQWAVGSGQWAVGSGQRTESIRQKSLGRAPKPKQFLILAFSSLHFVLCSPFYRLCNSPGRSSSRRTTSGSGRSLRSCNIPDRGVRDAEFACDKRTPAGDCSLFEAKPGCLGQPIKERGFCHLEHDFGDLFIGEGS